MSEIRVDRIVNASGSGAVEFSQGISLPTGQTLSGIAQTAESLTATANINTSGIITATSFSGDGSNLTGVGVTVDTRTNSLVVSGVSTFSDVNISGNLTVDGTTTTISSVNLVVEDKNIGIGSTSTPSNTTADGGGLTLFGGGDGDKTLTWVNSTAAWTSNQDLNLASGKVYEINGSTVLSSSQVLGKSVPSGTIVGDTDSQTLSSKTLCSGTLTGSLTAGGGTGSNGQFLQSTGSGVQWATSSGGAIAGCCVSNFLSSNTCAPNITSGANNFFVGCNAGLCLTSGSNNFFAGVCAGFSNNTGTHNNFFGQCAGRCNTSGRYNNFFGRYVGQNNISGNGNNFIGFSAGSSNTTGGYNVFIGQNSGRCNTTGAYNTFIGARSGRNITHGCHNIFFGCYAGRCSTTASSNIFIGCSSGCLVTGDCNVVIGSFTGTGFTACTNHIFLSDGAGNNRLQLNNCGSLGLAGANYGTAGQVLTSCGNAAAPVWAAAGGGSSAIAGCCVSNFLSCNTSANSISGVNGHNFFVGGNAGQCITTGAYNNFLGRCSGRCNTTGSNNNFLGNYAGAANSTGGNNFFGGCFAGRNNTTGTNNTFIGNNAGNSNTSGTNNIFIGNGSGYYNTRGECNTSIGCGSGNCNTTSCFNTFLGACAGRLLTGGCNVVIGSFTGTGFANCSSHVFLSDGAGNNRAQFNNSGAFGLNGANYGTAGQVLTSCGTGTPPVWAAAGGASVFCITGSNTIRSCNAGCCGSNNFFVGCNAGSGFGNPNPECNIAIGNFAGNYSGACGVTSRFNIFLGFHAGYYKFGGCDNFFAGKCSGRSGFDNRTSTTGCGNVAIGGFAGACLTRGSYNTFLGCNTGACLTTGCHNFFAGLSAGRYNTTGKYNISIGLQAAQKQGSGEYNIAFGPFSGSGASGIDQTAVTASNNFSSGHCAGSYNTTGCNNVFIGRESGAFFRFGNNNTAIGNCAMAGAPWSASSGSNNTFLGESSGRYSTTASHNFFAGRCSGYSNATGCNNIFIGELSGYSTNGGCNNFFAGSCAGYDNTTGCNNIAIGRNSGNDFLYDFGSTGGNNIIVMGNCDHVKAYVQVSWTTGSDARDKTNIIPIPVGKEFLKQLNPVQYQWKNRETDEIRDEKPNYGFLAQDILALEDAPTIIVDDHDPEHLKVRESMIVPVLVKTVQELIEEVDALKEEVRILKGE